MCGGIQTRTEPFLFFSNIPCFGSSFNSRSPVVLAVWRHTYTAVLLSVYCTWPEGLWLLQTIGVLELETPVLPRPQSAALSSQQDKPQGCPLSTFTTNSEHASLTSHFQLLTHSLPSSWARRVVHPLLHHKHRLLSQAQHFRFFITWQAFPCHQLMAQSCSSCIILSLRTLSWLQQSFVNYCWFLEMWNPIQDRNIKVRYIWICRVVVLLLPKILDAS